MRNLEHVKVAVSVSDPTKKELEKEEEMFLVIHLLENSDTSRFGTLKDELVNASFVGRNEYPETVSGAYELMFCRGRSVSHDNGSARVDT